MVSINFDGAAGHEKRTPDATHARTAGAEAAQPLRRGDRAPHGSWAALPLHRVDPSATWRLGYSTEQGRPQCHLGAHSHVWRRPCPTPM